jgi:hypothetical protein
MDAIKLGLPGVINLPQSLRPAAQNDPHVQWTLIGLEDQLWGKPTSLCGQLGMVCCLQDHVSSSAAKLLYNLGPNQSLTYSSDDNPELADLVGRVVFFYSARASQNLTCPNLHNPTKYEAQVFAESFCTQDVKDVCNCIGGVQVLFPLLETASKANESEAKDTRYLSLRTDDSESRRASVDVDTEWELVPSSSFSDWYGGGCLACSA